MSPAMVPLAFAALAVAGGGVVVYVSIRAERKRRAALAQLALTLGLSYLDKVPKATLAALGNFHLFRQGRRKMARNLMEGKAADTQVTLLDYQYTHGGGKNSHTSRQTVAIFRGAAAGLP